MLAGGGRKKGGDKRTAWFTVESSKYGTLMRSPWMGAVSHENEFGRRGRVW